MLIKRVVGELTWGSSDFEATAGVWRGLTVLAATIMFFIGQFQNDVGASLGHLLMCAL